MNEPTATFARAVAWRRPGDRGDGRLSVPRAWHGWGNVYMRRWTWTPPWGCTRWWLPSVTYFRAGDQHGNATLLIQVPFLGHVVFWKPWGRLRTSPRDKCAAEGRGDDRDQ